MLEVVPYELDEIKNLLKQKAIDDYGLTDAEFEGSNVSQLINLLAYSTLINNTNFTFGLNEMFITQAKDRRNVIKHARQMGYAHKRKVSYQYKIKLKVIDSGAVTLDKYSTFTSGNNTYTYFGEADGKGKSDIYGTYTYLKLLNNEYNNGVKDTDIYISSALNDGEFIISEEGQVCKILDRETLGDPRLLLELIDSIEVPVYSQLGQDVYITDGTYTNGYRNFTKIGTMDTFITDHVTDTFRIQISLVDGALFPFETEVIHPETTLTPESGGNLELAAGTEFQLYNVVSLVLDDGGASLVIDVNNITLNGKNIIIPAVYVDAIIEAHTGLLDGIAISNALTHEVIVTTNKDMTLGSLTTVSIVNGGDSYILTPAALVVNANDITIPPRVLSKNDLGLTPSIGIVNTTENTISGVNSVISSGGTAFDGSGIYSYSVNIGTDEITLLANGVVTSAFDAETINVNYQYYAKTENATITLGYSYDIPLTGYNANLTYNYVVGADGYLENRIFFSDFRGQVLSHETDYDPSTNTGGWNGFYASDYIGETNVLHFDIGTTTPSDATYGLDFHNPYFTEDGEALSIEKVIKTPFKKTRFSPSTEIVDPQTGDVTYTDYDIAQTFANIKTTNVKNELEVIVKEGALRRWNDETDASITARAAADENNMPLPVYINPELSLEVNDAMVTAGYLTIQDNDIENNGLEMFVTRILPDGSIEYDVEWYHRDYLLAEETTEGERSFVSMADVNYEDFINIYTKYAGTGTELSTDMDLKLNVLTSKGLDGFAEALIVPNDDKFEAKYYIEENLTPFVLHIEGSDIESTDSIRETAPLFSNTANRAVTKNDYKTICEAQPFIQSAQIWGGEEETPSIIPGHIFFGIIPESRPVSFGVDGNLHYLENIENAELFFATYYQITGKTSYDGTIDEDDKGVLFNLLDNYKIITLQLNYTKPIYMDYRLDVTVLKYKFGQTVLETNLEIFENVQKFFVREIEMFDAGFFKSSLTRYIDEKLGDKYGIKLDVKFSVDLYDHLYTPDEGTFINVTQQDMISDIDGNVGMDDSWKFIMPLDLPIEPMFLDDTIINNSIVERGAMIIDNITNCNTEDFIKEGDFLYMELIDGTFVSHDINGLLETIPANSFSETIEINIIYLEDITEYDNPLAIRYKVGSYFIHRKQDIIRLELNTHAYDNIEDAAYVAGITPIQLYEFDEVTGERTTPLYEVIPCALPRTAFTNGNRTMNINPNSDNIKSRRNVFSRLASLEFIQA